VPAFDGSRDPLVVTFKIIASGVEFTLINNHFTSKGGDNGVFGNVQPPVLNSEAGRLAQAQVINDYVDSLLAINPAANIVVAGDLNDFGFSPPVQTLIGGGTPVLTNLADALIAAPTDRYSYNFNGNSQELDHMLASSNAYSVATVFDIVHVNADFGRLQLSDHDPSVALFDARELAETLSGSSGVDTINGYGGNDSITSLNGDDLLTGDAGADTLNGGAGSDTLTGGEGDDFIYYDAGDTATNITGGFDTDTLFVASAAGPAPTGFNLTAQGFERAQVETLDTASNQFWQSILTVYTQSWVLLSEVGTYDTGDGWNRSWTNGVLVNFIYYDQAANDQPFQTYTISYNPAGQQVSIIGTFDDGRTFTTALDVGNISPWESVTTVSASTANGGQVLYSNTNYDNGDVSVATYINGLLDASTTYDLGVNDQPYQYFTTNYNAAGLGFVVSGIYDDGTPFAYLI
jgi:hypothetical protein